MIQSRYFRYLLPAILQMGLIYYLSSRPGDQIPDFGIPHLDKLIHFSLFFVLSFLWVRALCRGKERPHLFRYLLIAVLLSSLFGYWDEFIHQPEVSGRDTDELDFIANVFGALLGASFVFIYFKIKESVGALKRWDDSRP